MINFFKKRKYTIKFYNEICNRWTDYPTEYSTVFLWENSFGKRKFTLSNKGILNTFNKHPFVKKIACQWVNRCISDQKLLTETTAKRADVKFMNGENIIKLKVANND